MKTRLTISTLFALLVFATPSYAQYEDDTKTVVSTIEALYDVISGPKGEARDWDRFSNLFYPGAHLIPTRTTPDSILAMVWTPEEYAQRAGDWLVANGFYEKELARTQETYGSIVHVFSTYGSYHTKEDKEPYDRGINSIQLLTDGNRWYVMNVMWDAESQGTKIPEEYLSSR